MRKTPSEILNSSDPQEIHAWHVSATIDELHEYLRGVVTHSTLADHARDALDIKLAALARRPHLLLWLTLIVAVIGAAASVIGYWPQIVGLFHGRQ